MTALPKYFPIEDAASWLSTKLGHSVSADYLRELERTGGLQIEVRAGAGCEEGKSYWISRDQMESLLPAVTSADVKMINGKIDAMMQRRMDVGHAAEAAAEQTRLSDRNSIEERHLEHESLEQAQNSWSLKSADGLRFVGYRELLYKFMKQECLAGKPVPRPTDFIQYLRGCQQSDIVEVRSSEFDFKFSGSQPIKTVKVKQIGQAIRGLILEQ